MLALRNADDDSSKVMNFSLIVSGIYIWEYLTTFEYEWNVFRGRERYRWTIWIYSISRLCGLLAVVLFTVNFSLVTKIDCQAWTIFSWIVITLGCYGSSSMLIILRIYAIWNRNKIMLAIILVMWVSNIGYQITGGVRERGIWAPALNACMNAHLLNVKGLALSGFVTDVTLLLIMLVGLLRLRFHDGTFFDLAYVLWKQGVIWLFIALASQFPNMMFMFLNVGAPLNWLFSLSSSISIVIAGTYMYRALTYYASTPPNTTAPESPNFPKRTSRMTSNTEKNFCIVQNPPSNRLDVTVHKSFEEYPMSQMNHCGSHHSSDGKPVDKPLHDLGLDDNV